MLFISRLFAFTYFISSFMSHSRTRGLQSVSRREMLKINSSPSRHLQVGSKISRRNTKSEARDKIY
jgi:hypothetical protein